MPEFHKMLAMQLNLKKVIFVNIGGVTNITLINNEDIKAGDSSFGNAIINDCLLYTSPSPRDLSTSRMPSSA